MRPVRDTALAMLAMLPLMAAAQSGSPGNMAECVQMTRAPLQAQCRSIFASPAQAEQRKACLERVGPQLDAVCQQFFGAGSDFCATCTTTCNQTFGSGDGKRRECLAMCLQQPGCG